MREADGRRGRILFVEAHDDTREVLRRLLQPQYEVVACASGAEAIRTVARETFVAAIVCPALGDMAFADFLGQLRAVADIPVIVTTASAMARDMKDYEHLAVAGIVVKPFHITQLLPVLNMAILRKGEAGASFQALDFAGSGASGD